MAKTTPQKTKGKNAPRPTNILAIVKSKKVLALLLLLLAAVIGFKVYTHHTYVDKHYKQDKVAYAYLESRMQTVMDTVSATAGKPYEVNYTQGCAQASIKFTKGDMGCYTGYRFSYQVASRAEGKALTLKLFPVFRSLTSEVGSITPNEADIIQTFYYNFDEKYGRGCTYSYQLYEARVHNDTLGDNYHKAVSSPYAAEYLYNCGGPVVKPVYAVEKTP